MWKLSIEDDQGNKTVVNLVRDEYTLGRAEDNTVRLTERNISRHHAALNRDGSGWIIEDSESYNGCYVNGVRVGEPQRLEHGDLVQVGDYRLELVDDSATQVATSRAATVPAVPKSQLLLGQPDRIVMLVGPTPGAEVALVGERVVIGRGEECDIAINHTSVSRVHAEIQAVGEGRYDLVDRESANGVRLNGVELKRGLIDARDTIELGDVVFKYIPAGEIYLPGADESHQLGPGSLAPERLAPSDTSSGGISSTTKAVAAVFGLGAMVVVGMLVVRGGDAATPEEPVVAEAQDGATRVLREAQALLQGGQIEEAHVKVTTEIPEDSNVRQSQEFRDIEARWADMLFASAAATSEPTAKRELLERIVKTTTVDSARRKRAANELQALEGEAGVALADLPPTPTMAPDAPPKAKPKLQGGIVRNDPFATSSPQAKPPTASYPKPAAAPAPANTGVGEDLGDRAKLTASKNHLKSKVASGKATDKDKAWLRALCRQLGDMSCVN